MEDSQTDDLIKMVNYLTMKEKEAEELPRLEFTQSIRNPFSSQKEPEPVVECEPVITMKVGDVKGLFGDSIAQYGLSSEDNALILALLKSVVYFGKQMEVLRLVVHRKRSATTIDMDIHATYASFLTLADSFQIEKLFKEKRAVTLFIEQSRDHIDNTFCLHLSTDSSPSCKGRKYIKPQACKMKEEDISLLFVID